MNYKYGFVATVGFIFMPFMVYAQVITNIGTQCFQEDLNKAVAADFCVKALRSSQRIVTEGDIITCNIQNGLLREVECPK